MVVLADDTDVLVESEDRACQQEGLRHVVEQAGGHVVDVDDLVGNQRDAAHDEQHRTGVLRDFETRVFHNDRLDSYISVASPTAPRMAAMM